MKTNYDIAMKCADICEEIPLGHSTASANRIRAYAETLNSEWMQPGHANLIAAAPDLLAALEELMGRLEEGMLINHPQASSERGLDHARICEQAFNAIAKAKGEST